MENHRSEPWGLAGHLLLSSIEMLVPENKAHYFPPLGQCMYCGSRTNLSDEHIIPYALWGNLVLPESSCKSCAALTSKIELKVLRGFMHDARVAGNAPTRRKKKRPETLKYLLITSGETVKEKQIPVKDASGILILPTLAPAGILSGRPPGIGVTVIGTETITFGESLDQLIDDHSATGIKGQSNIDATNFARLLAKIAYGMTVAQHGLFPGDETPLLQLIRGDTEDASNWVGSGTFKLEIEEQKARHAMAVLPLHGHGGKTGLAVRVKLFANTGCTGYEVAVRVPGWEEYAAQQCVAADAQPAAGRS